MNLFRMLRHLCTSTALVKRRFPQASRDAIEAAIRTAESKHDGQIRFAVEGALGWRHLIAGTDGRQRALEIFSELRVWDTERNNGVLIYLLLADRDVEIVADRGVYAKLGSHVWEEISHQMESAFRVGKFKEGVMQGISAIGSAMAPHFPTRDNPDNEIPDPPVIL